MDASIKKVVRDNMCAVAGFALGWLIIALGIYYYWLDWTLGESLWYDVPVAVASSIAWVTLNSIVAYLKNGNKPLVGK